MSENMQVSPDRAVFSPSTMAAWVCALPHPALMQKRSYVPVLERARHDRGEIMPTDFGRPGVRVPVANGCLAPSANGHDHDPGAYIRLRLCEAVDTLRRLPYPRDGAPRALRAHWPEVHDRWRYAGQTRVLRVLPTAAEIDRLDETLPWLFFVPEVGWRQAAFLHAVPLGFRSIGRTLGISHECARRWGRQAIEVIVRATR